MLIMPPGHARAVRTPRRISPRERWVIRAVLGLVLVAAVGIAVAILTSGPKSRAGCVDITIPGPVGAQEIKQCGAAARLFCQSGGTGFTAQAARVIDADCRKAGLPVGS